MERASSPPARGSSPPTENERERLNRNFAELLQEVRVAQTGVQILFAFLLTLPFTAKFNTLGTRDVVAYAVCALGAPFATVLLVAPVSYHRMVFRQGRKPELVSVASTLAQIGLASFGLALLAGVFLIADVVVGPGAAAAVTAVLGLVLVGLWYVLPMQTGRMRSRLSKPERQGERT